jgi:hypothetical protein
MWTSNSFWLLVTHKLLDLVLFKLQLPDLVLGCLLSARFPQCSTQYLHTFVVKLFKGMDLDVVFIHIC